MITPPLAEIIYFELSLGIIFFSSWILEVLFTFYFFPYDGLNRLNLYWNILPSINMFLMNNNIWIDVSPRQYTCGNCINLSLWILSAVKSMRIEMVPSNICELVVLYVIFIVRKGIVYCIFTHKFTLVFSLMKEAVSSLILSVVNYWLIIWIREVSISIVLTAIRLIND